MIYDGLNQVWNQIEYHSMTNNNFAYVKTRFINPYWSSGTNDDVNFFLYVLNDVT